jgi:hypothetical protein
MLPRLNPFLGAYLGRGDVDYHEGADINVGEDIGNGVGDLKKSKSV